MAQSHKLCDHPATPAGRAACRKAGGPSGESRAIVKPYDRTDDNPVAAIQRAMTTRAAQPVVKGSDGLPVASGRSTRKRRATSSSAGKTRVLRDDSDLADVPARLASYARAAWGVGNVRVEFTPNPDGNDAGNEYLLRVVKAGSWKEKVSESFVQVRMLVTGPKTCKMQAWYKSPATSIWLTVRDVVAHIEVLVGQRETTHELKVNEAKRRHERFLGS